MCWVQILFIAVVCFALGGLGGLLLGMGMAEAFDDMP